MLKRLVVTVFASAVVAVPLAAPASAAPAEKAAIVKAVKPADRTGGISTQRIDWE